MEWRTEATARPARGRALGVVVAALFVLEPAVGLAARPGAEALPEHQARPRIGLVLGGGGAGGLAHVGVIRWLEEHRVPIDLVAGTSMGGLIGGIYATGADYREMDELLDVIDWSEVLSASAAYPYKAFRRKEDAREAPATFELGLRDGFKLPPGFNAGHQVGLLLDRIALPYSEMQSFDELPTPFACVAVDLAAGEQVVYRGGPMAEAMRATMSYPGWFAPVRSGDRVLVDGGALNNLPTDVMTDMGADVLIAVDLGMRAAAAEPTDNALGVMNRTLTVMMRVNAERNAELADFMITPDVSDFDFVDFARAADLVDIGYAAAAEIGDELVAYAVDEDAWRAYLGARRARRRVFAVAPDFIAVEGVVDVDAASVAASLDHHLGVALDPDHLDDDLTRITGWGRYDVVGYRGVRRGSELGLGIDVQEKTYGPPFLRPILDIRGSEFGEARSSFGGRFTFYDVAGANSEWRTDATYGLATRISTELFVPLRHEGLFIAPRAIAGRTTEFLYEAGESVAEYDVARAGGGADVGYLFGPDSQLRLGADLEYQRAEVDVGDPLLATVDGVSGTVRAEWLFDGTDSALIPTRGVRVATDAWWVFKSPDAAREFYQARLDLLGAHPLGGRFSFLGSVSGGTSFGATAAPLRQFLLGGPLRLGALGVGELRGSDFYFGRLGGLWSLADANRLSFFGTFYLAAFYELGAAFEDRADPYQDITFGLAGETILGGVYVGGAVGQDGAGGFFFAFGRLF